ncbi:MAG: hypothetical protein NC319_09175 [Butyricicoccus sp.]|nr:hypothetical protein [Butyricicoccus sp.]
MTDWFGAVSAYAREITVFQRGEVRKCRAFIQPLSVTVPERERVPTPAGAVDERRYLIIASPDSFDGGVGGEVRCGGRAYELLRCEMMGGGSHWEGVMRIKAGERDA